nr:hypothetical protein [Tanacetum cinerariifolium]
MRELIEDTFSRNNNDDAHEHVERILDIAGLFNIPGAPHDAVMLPVFHITLTRATKISKQWHEESNSRKVSSGCKTCGGAHLDKECLLREDVKSIEEVKYGMTYKKPSPILIEKVKVPRYTIDLGESFTKVRILGIEEMPKTSANIDAVRAGLMEEMDIGGSFQREKLVQPRVGCP